MRCRISPLKEENINQRQGNEYSNGLRYLSRTPPGSRYPKAAISLVDYSPSQAPARASRPDTMPLLNLIPFLLLFLASVLAQNEDWRLAHGSKLAALSILQNQMTPHVYFQSNGDLWIREIMWDATNSRWIKGGLGALDGIDGKRPKEGTPLAVTTYRTGNDNTSIKVTWPGKSWVI